MENYKEVLKCIKCHVGSDEDLAKKLCDIFEKQNLGFRDMNNDTKVTRIVTKLNEDFNTPLFTMPTVDDIENSINMFDRFMDSKYPVERSNNQ